MDSTVYKEKYGLYSGLWLKILGFFSIGRVCHNFSIDYTMSPILSRDFGMIRRTFFPSALVAETMGIGPRMPEGMPTPRRPFLRAASGTPPPHRSRRP